MNIEQLIKEYVAYRQGLGEQFGTNVRVLRAFARTVEGSRSPERVSPQKVKAFIDGTGPVTNSRRKRYDAVLGFYRYAISRGLVAHNPLPEEVPKWGPSLVPYIYTRAEIQRLLDAAETYPFQTLSEPATTRAVLLLLYGTGVRIREAIGLNDADVALQEGVITIRQTKFYKTRLVPIGRQLLDVLGQYAKCRRPSTTGSDKPPFFTSRTGVRINQNTFTKLFRRLCNHAGIRRDDAAYQPRLHDLRHTFAVHRLTAWYRQGADVQRLLPKLSVYLGHVGLSGTQLYLSMTPELLKEAGQRFEQYAQGATK
jgi:site-specific recombinase XerD